MKTIQLQSGAKGFDTNTIVSPLAATRMFDAGYRFALRYVPRVTQGASDVTANEVRQLTAAGLAVMPVQHVCSSPWTPNICIANTYGAAAAQYARAAGFLPGTTVWLDLEGVAVGTPSEETIRYCHEWWTLVDDAGFEPGIYSGWHCGLTNAELYALPFTRYWDAYNGDNNPLPRGFCMTQHAVKGVYLVDDGVGFEYDANTVRADAHGGLPTATTA